MNYLLISLISVLGRMIEGTGVLIGLGVLACWLRLVASRFPRGFAQL